MNRPALDYRSLSIEQRLALIGDIWDSIVDEDPEAVPVPAEHIAELERRLADEQAHPEDVIPWSELKVKLQHRPR
jgi:putative addiction module component (TIGR02574 family)